VPSPPFREEVSNRTVRPSRAVAAAAGCPLRVRSAPLTVVNSKGAEKVTRTLAGKEVRVTPSVREVEPTWSTRVGTAVEPATLRT
jgi:hypothetical protein